MGVSTYYDSQEALEIDRENLEKYGSTDFDVIEKIEEGIERRNQDEVAAKVQLELERQMPEIEKKAEEATLRKLRAEEVERNGQASTPNSPFVTSTVVVDGVKLTRSHFIPDGPVLDPVDSDIRLYFNDLRCCWEARQKNGSAKLMSRFVVWACLIVNATGPGSCRALVVFLRDAEKPLVFWGGKVEAAELRRQTQFHQRGLSYSRKDLFHESFLRALCICKAVYFLTLPNHAGWNTAPDGSRVFVSSRYVITGLNDIFFD